MNDQQKAQYALSAAMAMKIDVEQRCIDLTIANGMLQEQIATLEAQLAEGKTKKKPKPFNPGTKPDEKPVLESVKAA